MSSFPRPGQLNVQPIGLLDFLQAKTGGQYPQSLGGTLQPVTDLSKHYYFTQDKARRQGGYALTAGTTTNYWLSLEDINDPGPKQFWRRFSSFGITWRPLGATETISGELLTLDPLNGFWPHIFENSPPYTTGDGRGPIVSAGATAALYPIHFQLNNFWVPPGFDVGIWILNSVITGGTELEVAARWSDLRA